MLMRTDPFRELDRVAQQVFGTAARPAAMPIDAYRKGDEFVVLFDLPGCDPASINLTVERNVLAVHAQRHRPTNDEVELLIGERPTGTFSRQLFLAETLDSERIVADYTDGVLRLRVPVKEQAKPRRVDISVGGGPSGRQSRPAPTTRRLSRPVPACREPPERGGAVEHEPSPSIGHRPRRRRPALHGQPGRGVARHAARLHPSPRHRRRRLPRPFCRRAAALQPCRAEPHRGARRTDD